MSIFNLKNLRIDVLESAWMRPDTFVVNGRGYIMGVDGDNYVLAAKNHDGSITILETGTLHRDEQVKLTQPKEDDVTITVYSTGRTHIVNRIQKCVVCGNSLDVTKDRYTTLDYTLFRHEECSYEGKKGKETTQGTDDARPMDKGEGRNNIY